MVDVILQGDLIYSCNSNFKLRATMLVHIYIYWLIRIEKHGEVRCELKKTLTLLGKKFTAF